MQPFHVITGLTLHLNFSSIHAGCLLCLKSSRRVQRIRKLSFSVCLLSVGNQPSTVLQNYLKSTNLRVSRDGGSHGLNLQHALLQKWIQYIANMHFKKIILTMSGKALIQRGVSIKMQNRSLYLTQNNARKYKTFQDNDDSIIIPEGSNIAEI